MASTDIQSPPQDVPSKSGCMKTAPASAPTPIPWNKTHFQIKDGHITSKPEMKAVPIPYSEPPNAEPKPAPLPYAPDEIAKRDVSVIEKDEWVGGWKEVLAKAGGNGDEGEWRGEMQDGGCCSKPRSPPPKLYPGT
jgi:hypothetical protein